MKIAAVFAIPAAVLILAGCNSAEEKTAPEATTEAVEATGIADQALVDATVEQTAADAKAAAEAAEATKATEAQPEVIPPAEPAPAAKE